MVSAAVAVPATIANRVKHAKTRTKFLNLITVSFHLITIRLELQKYRVEFIELIIGEVLNY